MQLMGCSKISDASLVTIAAALPSTCRSLVLGVALCVEVSDAGVAALAGGLPSALEELKLWLVKCNRVDVAGLAAIASHLPDNVQTLVLRLSGTPAVECSELVSIAEQKDALDPSLTFVPLDFRKCLADVVPAVAATDSAKPTQPPEIKAEATPKAKAKPKGSLPAGSCSEAARKRK